MLSEEGFGPKIGGKIFHSTPKTKNFFKSFKAIKETVKNEKYNCVMRISEHSLSTFDLLAARLGGAKHLVYRSNNSATGGGKVNQILHVIFKWLAITIPTLKIAPSTEAAEFMFGKNCVKRKQAIIIKNAIAVEDFVFDYKRRNMIRKELNIADEEFVIGHVGRFANQKNHKFLIDIFSEIVKKRENSTLILVGKGELQEDIKRKIESLGLTNKVIFTGVRSDVPDIMMAMDVFILPSFFEGLPNTVVEAQATGLRCLVSDSVTKEVGFTDLVEFLSLELEAGDWANNALQYQTGYERRNMKKEFIKNGYDISSTAKLFEKYLFQP